MQTTTFVPHSSSHPSKPARLFIPDSAHRTLSPARAHPTERGQPGREQAHTRDAGRAGTVPAPSVLRAAVATRASWKTETPSAGGQAAASKDIKRGLRARVKHAAGMQPRAGGRTASAPVRRRGPDRSVSNYERSAAVIQLVRSKKLDGSSSRHPAEGQFITAARPSESDNTYDVSLVYRG